MNPFNFFKSSFNVLMNLFHSKHSFISTSECIPLICPTRTSLIYSNGHRDGHATICWLMYQFIDLVYRKIDVDTDELVRSLRYLRHLTCMHYMCLFITTIVFVYNLLIASQCIWLHPHFNSITRLFLLCDD